MNSKKATMVLVGLAIIVLLNAVVWVILFEKYSLSTIYSIIFEEKLESQIQNLSNELELEQSLQESIDDPEIEEPSSTSKSSEVNLSLKSYQPATMPNLYTKHITLPLSYDKHVENKEDFTLWKNSVKNKVLEEFQIPELSSIPLNPATKLELLNKGQLTLTKFSMQAFDDDQIIFYQILPQNLNEKYPTVVLVPGTGNQGAKDLLDLPSEWTNNYYQRGIALDIAKNGYAVFVIENRGWGERTIDAGSECGVNDYLPSCSGHLFSQHLKNLGFDVGGLQVTDTLQLIKFIKSLDFVDEENIAIGGLSLGGGIALTVSILDEDIKSTIAASGIVSINQTWSRSVKNPPAILQLDTSDMPSLLAPRYLYLSWGLEESQGYYFEATTEYTANKTKRAYQLFDADDHLMIIIHNNVHQYDLPSVLKFLDATIGTNS